MRSLREEDWQRKATDAAIDSARKITMCPGPLMNVPVGRLSDHEWGMIVAAAIFGWIEVRVQQGIAEGRETEAMVRMIEAEPSPNDTAVVKMILPDLADKAVIDWALPLASWSQEMMVSFLMLAWRLIGAAEALRDHGPGSILKKKPEFDEEAGDSIPF